MRRRPTRGFAGALWTVGRSMQWIAVSLFVCGVMIVLVKTGIAQVLGWVAFALFVVLTASYVALRR